MKLGQYVRAIEDFDAAVKLDPMNAEILYNRGVAKKMNNNTAGGNADIEMARSFNPFIGR